MTRRALLLLLLALSAACSGLPEGQKSNEPASGPPEIRPATVEEHAEQFDVDEPDRRAGSQDELAASVYIVAHLTDAGYVSRLDAVPVEDLVRSTNVVALPPSGEEPAALVVVAYDTGEGSDTGGHSIGTWLEVARALRAIEPEHDVQFVALGAEHATVEGGQLGSRRLAQQLEDDGKSPPVILVQDVVVDDEPVAAGGAAAGALADEAKELGLIVATGTTLAAGPGDVFTAAGLDTTVVGGGAAAAGPALLAYLASL